jgi:hypothetical protein
MWDWRFVGKIWEARRVVANIELAILPPRQTTWSLVFKVLGFPPLPQLKTTPSNLARNFCVGLRFKMEKIAE